MNNSKFVIKQDTWGNQNYYSQHGEFAGKKEVMSYTTKNNAKQFDTREEAEDHILNNLPEWTKKEKYVVEELSRYDVLNFR